MSFWREECPSRGIGLTHAHWSDCKPPENHPNGLSVHQYDTCCHCEQKVTVEDAQPGDHSYVPTILGLCLRCHQPLIAHLTVIRQIEPEGEPVSECSKDHRFVGAKYLIGDEGLTMTACPDCGVLVEPRAITGEGPQGATWEKGRGELTPRQKNRLIGWAGWEVYNGGP